MTHELRKPKKASDILKEKSDYIALDPSPIVSGESGVQDEGRKGKGTVSERPEEVFVEHTSEGDHVNQGAHDTAPPGRSRGEYRSLGHMLV